MTLGALQIAAEEDPSDVPRDQVRLGLAIQVEPRGGRILGSPPSARSSSPINTLMGRFRRAAASK